MYFSDSISDGIDSILEEEEQYADQLKEYLFFADALQNVCRHHEGLQLAVENAEECLTSR